MIDYPVPERISALVLAAGSGERLGGKPKAFLEIGGQTLLEHCVRSLQPFAGQILIGVRPEDVEKAQKLLPPGCEVIEGGAERQDTFGNLLNLARGEFVLIHDVARPLTSKELFERVLSAASKYQAASPVMSASTGDSMALREDGDVLGDALPRDRVVFTQTPYAFQRELLVTSFKRAREAGTFETSVTTLVTKAGYKVHIVPGEPANFKITYPEDWERASRLLAGY